MSAVFVVFLFISFSQLSVGKALESTNRQTLLCSAHCNFKNGYCGPNNQCRCYSGWRGANCDQCERAVGCRNGTCEQPGECNCREGYGGRHCQLDMKYCERRQPCQNGGLCTNDRSGSFICKCRPGYRGSKCTIRANLLVRPPIVTRNQPQRHTCNNGGTCVTLSQSHECTKCQCPNGFAGKTCEIQVRMCVTRPCANGAMCQDLHGDYRCKCSKGFQGKHCDIDVNECSILGTDACENGGQCVNLKGSYTCKCRRGFEGARCDKRVHRIQKLTSTATPLTRRNGESSLNVLIRSEHKPSHRIIANVHKPSKKSSTNIKVTHHVQEVEINHIDLDITDPMGSELTDTDNSVEQASVSIVQAVTFALLGVAIFLFVIIAGFIWLHQSKKESSRKCCLCYEQQAPMIKSNQDNEDTVVTENDSEVPASLDIYRSIPGKAHRAVASPCDRLSGRCHPPVDCLYVALPHNNSVRNSLISSADLTGLPETLQFS